MIRRWRRLRKQKPRLPTYLFLRRPRINARVPGTRRSCTVAITWELIERRIKRLDELSIGLAREDVLWTNTQGDDPLRRVELVAYLKAIRDALAGIETARVVLAKARQRHAEGRK
jgi:hypothetical protein